MDEEPSHHEPDLGAPFALVSDGYAQDEVDSVVEQYERRRSELAAQRIEKENSLAEADSRLQALEARASELEEGGAGGSPLPELANDLLHKAKEIGRELESHVLSQAEAKRDELKQTTEAAESARGRAGELVAKAQRDRDEQGRTVEASRRQVDQFLQDSRMMAEHRGRGVWEKARGRLREPVLELEHLNEQRRAMLQEILELQESLDTSWSRIFSEDDVPAPPTPSTGRSEDGVDEGTEPETDSGSPEGVGPDEGSPPVVEMGGAGSPGVRQQKHEPPERGAVFDAERWFAEVAERAKKRREQDPTRPE